MDHLDGVLMLDRISREERKEAMRAMREARAGGARDGALDAPVRTRGRDGREPRLAAAAAGSTLRTVYLGTSEFAAAVLERLAASEHRPALVLSRPDRPRGRGRKLAAPPVAERARALGIELEQPESVNEPPVARADRAGAAGCAGGVRVRGADQGAAAVRAGDAQRASVAAAALARGGADRARDHGRRRETGVSIMRLTAGLDSGPVCLTATEPIAAQDTYGSLAARLRELGGELLVRALDLIARASRRRSPSRTRPASPTPRRSAPRTACSIRPGRASELERVVRALHPHIGARVALADGTLLGVHRARVGGGEDSRRER